MNNETPTHSWTDPTHTPTHPRTDPNHRPTPPTHRPTSPTVPPHPRTHPNHRPVSPTHPQSHPTRPTDPPHPWPSYYFKVCEVQYCKTKMKYLALVTVSQTDKDRGPDTCIQINICVSFSRQHWQIKKIWNERLPFQFFAPWQFSTKFPKNNLWTSIYTLGPTT